MTVSALLSLDARYYTDPQIFKTEQQSVFASTWQFAGHRALLEKTGDYFTFELAGESLFCVLGRDGEIRTFYNVCQHRAHQLVSGTGSSKIITCPYHAWTYDLEGQFRAGPNTKSVAGFDGSKICLTSVRTELFLGFIFVNLDNDAAPMDEWFPQVRQELESFVPHWQELRPLETVEIPENCNWKVSIENYSECYHCSLNHPTFSQGVVKPETYDIQPQGYCLRHTTQCQNLDDMTYQIDSSKQNALHYSSWFLWPLFSFQVYPGNVINTYHWRAIDSEHVIVYRGWYTGGGHGADVINKLAIQDRQTTVEEDIHLVQSVQRGLHSRGYNPGPLVLDPKCGVNSEHSIKALQSWMRDSVDSPEKARP